MVADALAGKIDLIITKSVSRFARNTVDTLSTVRKLKEKGVEVYFEKENIYTMDSKGELLITIMSSLAQEESRSISENTRWGQRKRFADGKITLPYEQFLGYERGEDGFPKIVEEEAEIVRMMYRMYLEGKTTNGIAKHLTETGIPTPSGKSVWSYTTVNSILSNEKYKGEALLQKGYTVDFLTKKRKMNTGEVQQYYVENSHPAIIPPEVHDMVQEEMKKRKTCKGYKTSGSVFSGRIVCGDCGSYFGSKTWHSTSKYRRTVWRCNKKYESGKKCNTPHVYEKDIKEAFVEQFNALLSDKKTIIAGYREAVLELMNTEALEQESLRLQAEQTGTAELIRECVAENAKTALDQNVYRKKYERLAGQYEKAKARLEEIQEIVFDRQRKQRNIEAFMQTLECREGLLDEFDEGLWYSTVEAVRVDADGGLEFVFKNGN